MIDIWIVRHGQTDWNVDKRVQGWTDVPLNPTGIAQAERLADCIANIAFDHIYTSDLSRAYRTAEILQSGLGCPLTVEPLLRERRFGTIEGSRRDEQLSARTQSTALQRYPVAPGYSPDGETVQELASRAERFLDKMVTTAHSDKILCVSHGGYIRALLSVLGEQPPANLHNTGITQLRWNGSAWKIGFVDWAGHLTAQDSGTQPLQPADW